MNNHPFEPGLFRIVPLSQIGMYEEAGYEVCGNDLMNLGVKHGCYSALMRIKELPKEKGK